MLIAIFFISCSSDAPSLVGKWQMKKSEVDEKQKIESTWDMDLKADNTLSMAIEMLLEGESDGFSMKLPMSLAFDGKWNSTDKVIVISADTTTTKFAIDKEKMDFKFTNSTEHPVYIEGYTSGKRITFNIYGIETRDPGHRV